MHLTKLERYLLQQARLGPLAPARARPRFEAQEQLLRLGLIEKRVYAGGAIRCVTTQAGIQELAHPTMEESEVAEPRVHKRCPVDQIPKVHCPAPIVDSLGCQDPPLGDPEVPIRVPPELPVAVEAGIILANELRSATVTPPGKETAGVGNAKTLETTISASPAHDLPSIPGVLQLIPGGFVHRGQQQDLSGNNWKVLREFIIAPHHRRSCDQLLATIWDKESSAEKQAVLDAVCAIRKALRAAMAQGRRKKLVDPLPCVDKGQNCAWELRV
jgi:hypothetical protein